MLDKLKEVNKMLDTELILEINGKTVIGNKFAYEGCHKIYICENENDILEAMNIGYKIFDIEYIEEVYNNSCSLRFINNWKLTEVYAEQFEEANFNWVN